MPKILLLAMPGCMASSVQVALDIFYVANRCLEKSDGSTIPDNARFSAQVVSPDGKAVETASGQRIQPELAMADAKAADIVIVTSLFEASASHADVDNYLAAQQEAAAWLKARSAEGALVASACSGTFLLAEAGLMDGREATTHWLLEGAFRRRYPRVRYHGERMLLEYGNVICGGAFFAFTDILLKLLERYGGRELALMCARLMLLEPNRELQQPFLQQSGKQHEDDAIRKAERWLKHHFDKPISVDSAAEAISMGTRNFKRRFKAATGVTPIEYLQRVRIDAAKRQLEQSSRTSIEVIWSVGYEDASSFRRLFKRQTGVTMEQYRRRFGPASASG
ncbi:GlxA family transcriptional regulator [Shewanella litorisediminis]|uniref:Helix-turn-helix domain-containing protein n=1 Tax=Shewanella litorisediminis TaxID=1173586 RepID=A0ABX7G0J3_9GAMM|nr:helix-turn-helix domain-containing protein [Shewanella litorisediminis]MCL2918151.1 helix-turn-helix domain-containing protein [Shewanella litorisediminis]QRH00793.1 helix-turn-helix domain-containing protein [Shewanella litorisediminis]